MYQIPGAFKKNAIFYGSSTTPLFLRVAITTDIHLGHFQIERLTQRVGCVALMFFKSKFWQMTQFLWLKLPLKKKKKKSLQ